MREQVDVERMTALELERDFLLRSLEDLEREHEAGDVDEADYRALKDDYTARAAAAIRALEAGGTRSRRPRAPRSPRGLLVAAAVVVFAVVAGVLVAQSAGRREAGDVITGDVAQTRTELLNQAGRLSAQGDYEGALARYEEVLAEDPTNPEALTYKGWVLTLTGDERAGLESLLAAATEHPDYPDVHAFLAIVFFRNGLVDEAARELDRLEQLDPPAGMRELTDGLRAQIEEARASTTTTAAGASPAG